MHENEMRWLAILFNDLSIILGVIIELIFQRVELARANSMELVSGKRHVRDKRNQAHDKERSGVMRRGNFRKRIELRERHGEHRIERQGLRAMLQPCTTLREERGDGAGDEESQTRVR